MTLLWRKWKMEVRLWRTKWTCLSPKMALIAASLSPVRRRGNWMWVSTLWRSRCWTPEWNQWVLLRILGRHHFEPPASKGSKHGQEDWDHVSTSGFTSAVVSSCRCGRISFLAWLGFLAEEEILFPGPLLVTIVEIYNEGNFSTKHNFSTKRSRLRGCGSRIVLGRRMESIYIYIFQKNRAYLLACARSGWTYFNLLLCTSAL